MNQKNFLRYSLENLTLQKQFGAMKWGNRFLSEGQINLNYISCWRGLVFDMSKESWKYLDSMVSLLPSVCLLQGQCPALPSAPITSNRERGSRIGSREGEYFPEHLTTCFTFASIILKFLSWVETFTICGLLHTLLIYYQHLSRRYTSNITIHF